ncbi:MAG: hypothetical protein U5L00_07560 [Desulfovermiculus sp.]|nr:hypothetical protein [Desulfovermiculus sp.]
MDVGDRMSEVGDREESKQYAVRSRQCPEVGCREGPRRNGWTGKNQEGWVDDWMVGREE